MPSLEFRRILRLGGSLAVTLPPGWAAYYRLEPGDKVEVQADHNLTLKPPKRRRRDARPQA
jgi:antitoxin component of MazEF toxin-antitoxin module